MTESTSDDEGASGWRATLIRLWPGMLTCAIIALAASFISDHYGGPVLLYALLFGMVLHFMSEEGPARPGIDFVARTVLRVGVALLGARITIEQVTALGFGTILLVVTAVVLTIGFGFLMARALRLPTDFGMLSGGATAICGVSAAMALAAVMPRSQDNERNLIATVVGVAALSTVAMILYPVLVSLLALTNAQAGIFLGATIHDVAQVVGAGYMISPETGEASTVVKLMRVALLVPAVFAFGLFYRTRAQDVSVQRPPLLPAFLLAFVALVIFNSAGLIPATVAAACSEVSRWCLIAAIAALGLRTALRELVKFGWRPVILMVSETLFIALIVLAVILATAA